ncbi:MAG: TcpQ domain-containing protein [Pseudomonadota bacterium]
MRNIILGFLALTILTAPANVLAQSAAKGIPQFIPTAGWTVKPAVTGDTRQLSNIKLPCMMMVEYDNGYVMRLSGGNFNMMAMALDFRQDAFVQGRKYQGHLSIDGTDAGKVEATAFSKNALVINTRRLEKLYQKLQAGKNLTMDIEGNSFQFRLGGVAQALTRLEACYSGKNMDMSVASLPQPMGAPQDILSATTEQITWSSPAASDVSMPSSQPRRVKPGQIWRARAGDSLEATLTRWAEEAGVDIDWQADMPGHVMTDYAMATGFEEAVQTLIAENAAATGIQANLMGAPASMDIETAYHSPTAAPFMAGPAIISEPPAPGKESSYIPVNAAPRMMRPAMIAPPPMVRSSAKWTAAQGSNLRLALERWSQEAGVELFWRANQSYAVRSTVASSGSYEDALRQILTQYTGDSVRPFAQLNNDPVTGQRVLIVQSSNIL